MTERPTTWGAVIRWPCCDHCGRDGGGCSGVHPSPCAHAHCAAARRTAETPPPGWAHLRLITSQQLRAEQGLSPDGQREVAWSGPSQPVHAPADASGWTDPAVVDALADTDLGERPEVPTRPSAADALRYCDTCTVWGSACSEHRGAQARPVDLHGTQALPRQRELRARLVYTDPPDVHVHRVVPPTSLDTLNGVLYIGAHEGCTERRPHHHTADGVRLRSGHVGEQRLRPDTDALLHLGAHPGCAVLLPHQHPADGLRLVCHDCTHPLSEHTAEGCRTCVCTYPWDTTPEPDWNGPYRSALLTITPQAVDTFVPDDQRTVSGEPVQRGAHPGCDLTGIHTHSRVGRLVPEQADLTAPHRVHNSVDSGSPCCGHQLGEHLGPDGCTVCACPKHMTPASPASTDQWSVLSRVCHNCYHPLGGHTDQGCDHCDCQQVGTQPQDGGPPAGQAPTGEGTLTAVGGAVHGGKSPTTAAPCPMDGYHGCPTPHGTQRRARRMAEAAGMYPSHVPERYMAVLVRWLETLHTSLHNDQTLEDTTP